jgi:hypothetical protein
VRVYLPSTTSALRELLDAGQLGPAPLTAFAVTPALREWYAEDDDLESLEYAAMQEAARGSLRLLDADETAARRRVVVALDVSDGVVDVRDDLDRGVVLVTEPVAMVAVASVHVDDEDAEATVALAAESVIAADLGDPGSQERVDDAEGFDLSWYANQEIGPLLELL